MFRVIALGVVREMPAADSMQNTILMNAQVWEGRTSWLDKFDFENDHVIHRFTYCSYRYLYCMISLFIYPLVGLCIGSLESVWDDLLPRSPEALLSQSGIDTPASRLQDSTRWNMQDKCLGYLAFARFVDVLFPLLYLVDVLWCMILLYTACTL